MIGVFIAALTLSLMVLVGWELRQARVVQLANAATNSDNLVRSLAQHTSATIQAADLVLGEIVERLDRDGAAATEAPHLTKLLRERAAVLPQIREFVVLDEAGNWILSSRPSLSPINNADRDYFIFHRADTDGTLRINTPLMSRTTGRWTLLLTRRVNHAGGGFAGVAIAAIDLDYFQRFYETFNIGRSGSLAVYREDGTLLIRRPFDEANIGRKVSMPLFSGELPKAISGHVRVRSPLDGVIRLGSYRRLSDYPLLVNVALGEDETLADWRADAWSDAIVVTILAALAALLGALVVAQLRRRAAAERDAAIAAGEYRLLADNSSDMIMRRSLDGRRLYVSPSSRELLGYAPEELTEHSIFESVHPDDLERVRPALTTLPAHGEIGVVRFRSRRRDGSYIWVEVTQRLVVDEATGVPREIVSATRNISARKAVEEQLAFARDAADQASQVKSDFLANMSHEIRTPMNGVIGMNGLLLKSELTAEQREWSIAVRDSAQVLLVVINSILDISKLEAGKVDLENVDFDLADTVEAVVSLFGPGAHDKNIDLGVLLDPAARAGFYGDPTRLRQILLNLIGNAVKFTEKGGVSVEVSFPRAAGAGVSRARFEICDSGPGMSLETCDRLFQKFSQADNSVTRRFGGTGLGLAISRQLVKLMGGSIGVESAPGFGSRFWFEVPLPPAIDSSVGRGALPDKLKGLRVLVVEDADINRRILARQLSGYDLDVSTVHDDLEAIDELARARHRGRAYDFVVIDRTMPEPSGGALTRRIRAVPENAGTTIVITSWAGAQDLSREGYGVADAILTKPVREQAVLDIFTRVPGSSDPALSKTAPPAPPAAICLRVPQSAALGRRLNILVAEDNKINQMLLMGLLKSAGHRIDVVEDGERAVEAVRDGAYDVVLMDIQMPVLGGVEAAKRIRLLAQPQGGVPIIAVTANAMPGAREEYIAAGMTDYLSKPIDAAVLFAKLAEISLPPAPAGPDIAVAPGATGPGLPAADLPDAGLAAVEPRTVATSGVAAQLDAARLRSLGAILTEDKVSELLRAYLGQARERLARMLSLAAAGDLDGLGREAHAASGSASNVGAMRVSKLAAEIETACKTARRTDVEGLVRELPGAADAAADAIHDWLRTRKPTDPSARATGEAA
jgi:PAS domain S-box-containing protein